VLQALPILVEEEQYLSPLLLAVKKKLPSCFDLGWPAHALKKKMLPSRDVKYKYKRGELRLSHKKRNSAERVFI
jgi:hypothetical protein